MNDGHNETAIALGAIGGLVVSAILFPRFFWLGLIGAVVIVFVMRGRSKRRAALRYHEDLRAWYEQNPQVLGPTPSAPTTRPPEPPRQTGWAIAGTVVSAVAAVGGLMVLAGIIFLVIAIGSGNAKLFPNK